MSYDYQTERPYLFTESGAVMLLKIRDNVKRLITLAGAVRADKAWDKVTGDSWTMLACLDYLVELKEITAVTGNRVCGQHQIFTAETP